MTLAQRFSQQTFNNNSFYFCTVHTASCRYYSLNTQSKLFLESLQGLNVQTHGNPCLWLFAFLRRKRIVSQLIVLANYFRTDQLTNKQTTDCEHFKPALVLRHISILYWRNSNLLVPTLWLDGMSMVFVLESCFTAKPKSAMTAVPFFFTRTFLDFRSLWAMAGFPRGEKVTNKGAVRYHKCFWSVRDGWRRCHII